MSERKQVLGIVGSPRRGGNTETLVDEVLRGAAEAGAATEKIILSALDIAPCDACDACKDSGECILADDMEELLDKMARSEVWVLGTPVYWWGPSAQFKAFVDRWYSKAQREEDKAFFQGRRVILVVPFGDSEVKTAQHVVGMMTDALDYVEAEFFATVLAPGVNDPGEVRAQSEVLAAAYRAGREAVSKP
ncbi:MAG: flavodoxin family protein [Chloroflexi bacterium]|nr:flavodoxin family protein [Chloroflexota bacterium]